MVKSSGNLRLVTLALCLILRAVLPASGGEDCPAPVVYETLTRNMKELRAAMARRFGESWNADRVPEHVRDEYERLTRSERDGWSKSRDLADQWGSIASDREFAEFDRKEIDRKQRQIDRDQKALNDKFSDLARRVRDHNADALRQHASMPDPNNHAAVDAYNAWGARIDRRKAALEAEERRLNKEQEDIKARRDKLAADMAKVIAKINKQIGRSSGLMRQMSPFLSRTGSDAAHALALAKLLDSGVEISTPPARHQSYAEVAAEVEREIAETVAKEVALQAAKRTVLATGPGLAVAAADVIHATGDAAVDVRTREVEQNLLLIGDYAQVLKRMKQGGTLQADDPAYQAIRTVLKEQGEAMPEDGADVVIEGLASWRTAGAAITATVAAVAGNYAGKKAERAGTAVINRLGSMDRRVIGEKMVRFFETAINSVAESGSSVLSGDAVKLGGKWVDEQLNGPRPVEPEVRPDK